MPGLLTSRTRARATQREPGRARALACPRCSDTSWPGRGRSLALEPGSCGSTSRRKASPTVPSALSEGKTSAARRSNSDSEQIRPLVEPTASVSSETCGSRVSSAPLPGLRSMQCSTRACRFRRRGPGCHRGAEIRPSRPGGCSSLRRGPGVQRDRPHDPSVVIRQSTSASSNRGRTSTSSARYASMTSRTPILGTGPSAGANTPAISAARGRRAALIEIGASASRGTRRGTSRPPPSGSRIEAAIVSQQGDTGERDHIAATPSTGTERRPPHTNPWSAGGDSGIVGATAPEPSSGVMGIPSSGCDGVRSPGQGLIATASASSRPTCSEAVGASASTIVNENGRDDRAAGEKLNRVTHVAPPSSSAANTPYRSKIYSCKEQMSQLSVSNNHLVRDPRPARDPALGDLRPRQTHAALAALLLWPRAESNLYAETKRLVDTWVSPRHGKSGTVTGKRTVYSITDRGRDCAPRVARDTTGRRAGRVGGPPAAALRELRLQGRPPRQRSSRSKTTHGGRSTTTLSSEPSTHAEKGLFPDRIHVNALLASLSIEQARATVRWARRSRGAVEAWETTEPGRRRVGRQDARGCCA